MSAYHERRKKKRYIQNLTHSFMVEQLSKEIVADRGLFALLNKREIEGI